MTHLNCSDYSEAGCSRRDEIERRARFSQGERGSVWSVVDWAGGRGWRGTAAGLGEHGGDQAGEYRVAREVEMPDARWNADAFAQGDDLAMSKNNRLIAAHRGSCPIDDRDVVECYVGAGQDTNFATGSCSPGLRCAEGIAV